MVFNANRLRLAFKLFLWKLVNIPGFLNYKITIVLSSTFFIQSIVIYELYHMHCILYNLIYAWDSMYDILCIIFNEYYVMHCTLLIVLIVFYELYSMHCIICIVFNALFCMHSFLCIVFKALYSMLYIKYIVSHALYSMCCMICIVIYGGTYYECFNHWHFVKWPTLNIWKGFGNFVSNITRRKNVFFP